MINVYGKIKRNPMIVAIIIILLLALLVFLFIVKTKVKEAFQDPSWLSLDVGFRPAFGREWVQAQCEQLLKYRVDLDMDNTEFNYGHDVKTYHSEED